MSTKTETLHNGGVGKVLRWIVAEEFLDTATLRGIAYGNLFLRKKSHHYLLYGVVAAILFLFFFWITSANWDALTGWTGLFEQENENEIIYTAVTTITQLPPPPPIEKPKLVPPKPSAPAKVEKPPNVGKVKKVKKEEALPEQTLATQKEIKQAAQQGIGGIGDGPVFVPVEQMPRFKRQKKPRYPESARRAGIEGRVFVAVLISENGKAIKSQVMSREPPEKSVFDKAAVEAVMKSTYYPGAQNGRPVKVWLMIPIRFTLR